MVNPKWNGPIAMAFAAVATTLYMTRPGCLAERESTTDTSGGWCVGDNCSPLREVCETDRKRMESPPPCERVTERWCAGASCFRWKLNCNDWRDAQVRGGAAVEVCKLTPWR